jgi:hypothetical protein
MITRSRVLAAAILVLAGVLSFLRVPVASSQGLTLFAAYVSEDLPVADPDAAAWQTATAVEVPLSAQQTVLPRLASATIQSVTARALHNGAELALLVEWTDDTQDDRAVTSQEFRDAAAVQFPLVEGPPFVCMGQAGTDVNIWHWKADWQADLLARQDVEAAFPNMYVDYYPFTQGNLSVAASPQDYTDLNYLPALAAGNLLADTDRTSPIEDLVAGGFGTITSQPADQQNVSGSGSWADGYWKVIFARDLISPEAEDVTLRAGQVIPLAFAVWDGSNGERDGQKSTSQWISLQLAQAPAAAPAEAPAAAAPATSREPYIFVIGPMAGVLALIVVGAAGLYVVGSLTARRR